MSSMLDCPTPRTVEHYGRVLRVRCACRSCPTCGVLWLGDTRIRVLAAAHSFAGSVALVTVTAPGVDVLPWDASGKRVAAWYAAEWNRTAPARWSALHRAAARAARRRAKELRVDWRLLVKVWEYQKRGVLHLHLIVPAGCPGELAASKAYVDALAGGAAARGFGFVDRGRLPAKGARRSSRTLVPVAPGRAAGYCAAYVASAGAGKPGIAEVARRQGVPGAVVYVAQALTRRSGVTMRSLRARRRVVCLYEGATASEDAWHAACLLDALERGNPPMTAEQRGALLAVATAARWRVVVNSETGETKEPNVAPLPPSPHGGASSCQPRRTVALVRLDFVQHRGHQTTQVRLLSDHQAAV